MLNEFVSVVISGNEEHRKLMEMTCLVKRQLPVVLIEVPIFSKQVEHIRQDPGDMEGREPRVCVQYIIDFCEFKCLWVICVCVCVVCFCVHNAAYLCKNKPYFGTASVRIQVGIHIVVLDFIIRIAKNNMCIWKYSGSIYVHEWNPAKKINILRWPALEEGGLWRAESYLSASWWPSPGWIKVYRRTGQEWLRNCGRRKDMSNDFSAATAERLGTAEAAAIATGTSHWSSACVRLRQ